MAKNSNRQTMKQLIITAIFCFSINATFSQVITIHELLSLLSLKISEMNTKLRKDNYKVVTATTVEDEVIISYSKTPNESIAIGGTVKKLGSKSLKSILYQTDDMNYMHSFMKEIQKLPKFKLKLEDDKSNKNVYYFSSDRNAVEISFAKDTTRLHYVFVMQL